MTKPLLGEPEFLSTSQLQKYCENGRNLIRPLGNELRIAAEELKATLGQIPGNALLAQSDSKLRARIVASHLVSAAEGVEATCTGLIRTYLSFRRHFIDVTPEKSKKHFDLNG
jgi:hypothetical protein